MEFDEKGRGPPRGSQNDARPTPRTDEGLQEPRRKGRWVLPFLLFVFGALPLYVLAGASAYRSHLLTHGPVTPDDARAAWVFLAAWTAGFAAVVSGAMAWSHNSRSLTLERQVQKQTAALNREAEERVRVQEQQNHDRLVLDTAVTGLGLLTTTAGNYAARSTVAGALAALVHLGHPIIAMRALMPAWADEAVDAPTGCWLIGEVFRTADDPTSQSIVEAAELLYSHSSTLTGDRPGDAAWPQYLEDHWEAGWNYSVRINIIEAACHALCSRSKSWWQGQHHWPAPILDEAIRAYDGAPGSYAQVALAARALAILLRDVSPSRVLAGHYFGTKFKTYKSMAELIGELEDWDKHSLTEEYEATLRELRAWQG